MTTNSAFLVNVNIGNRTLTAIASQVPESRSFKVFIAGVCNLVIFQDQPGHWSIEDGRPVMPELVQAIGVSLFE